MSQFDSLEIVHAWRQASLNEGGKVLLRDSLQGAIEWPKLLRPICNYAMNLIRVPVGNYMGPGSGGAKITSLAFSTIASLACSTERGPIEHLGKLLMYSIRPSTVAVPEYPALGPLEALKTFANLLEHFYQVPNAGEYVLETQAEDCCKCFPTLTSQNQLLAAS
jgi:hypothetical protein